MFSMTMSAGMTRKMNPKSKILNLKSLCAAVFVMVFLSGGFLLGAPKAQAAKYIYDTNATTTFNVPLGVTWVQVKAWGAGGGGGNSNLSGSTGGGGGGGGFAGATVAVTSTEALTVYVGSEGHANSSGLQGGGGGGQTGFFRNGTGLIIAGGGGAGNGRLCLWNGASFTIMEFASNSATPIYSTSSVCNAQ